MNSKEVKQLNAAIRNSIKGFKPPEKLTVSEWADKKRRLSSESSAEAGAWRTSRTPYLKDIMDAFTDAKCKHIIFVSSSQVGKSETINNMLGYVIDEDPGSMLFIHPTGIDAKEYSKLRIAPMFRDTPALKRKVSDPKSRDSGNTILQKTYPGGILTLCGSTEAHALASKPIRYIFGDERDRWAVSAGNEGDPWSLATARQITFYNSKAVEVSTPTVKGASAIEAAYVQGSMEHWCSRCPHCGEYKEIVFESIRFDYEEIVVNNQKTYKINEIYYICPVCGGVSSEAEMKKAPAKWIAENPDAYNLHGTRSFWLASWISPWASWESTIVMYLEARGNSKKMQVVYNTRFGLLWEDRGDIEDEDSLLARREEYEAELPDGVLLLTCGVDTQDDRLEYEVVGHGHFYESWGIKKGVIMGKPDNDAVWEELDTILDHSYSFKNGVKLKISTTFVDEGGHYTQDVRYQCLKRQGKKVFAIKGRGGNDIPYTSPPRSQKIVMQKTYIGQCYVFEIGVDAGKQNIMDSLKVKTIGSKYCHFPKRDDYGPRYFHGLLSERMVYKAGLKHPWVWEKIPGHERNEPLDLRNYANAAAKALMPDFDALEQKIRNAANSKDVVVENKKVKRPSKTRVKRIDGYNEW